MKIQVCFPAKLSVHSEGHRVWLLFFPGAADPTLSTDNVLWTHVLFAWLDWPHPPPNRKKVKNPNITRHNMHLPWFFCVCVKTTTTTTKKRGKKNPKSAIKSVFSFAQDNLQRSTMTGEQSSLVKKAESADTQGQ